MKKIKLGDIIEPIMGFKSHGYTAQVIKVFQDDQLCVVKFTSPKVKPPVQVRTIQNLMFVCDNPNK